MSDISMRIEQGRITDITRELISAEVYPGDPVPSMERVMSVDKGDMCNLSRLSMGTHSGTHIDAPLHFISGGRDIASINNDILIGRCIVADTDILDEHGIPVGCERLLIRTMSGISEQNAAYIARSGVKLLGVEASSVGNEAVHKLLLGREIILLESLDLSSAENGEHYLFCAPLRIAGADGAPCRAYLL